MSPADRIDKDNFEELTDYFGLNAFHDKQSKQKNIHKSAYNFEKKNSFNGVMIWAENHFRLTEKEIYTLREQLHRRIHGQKFSYKQIKTEVVKIIDEMGRGRR